MRKTVQKYQLCICMLVACFFLGMEIQARNVVLDWNKATLTAISQTHQPGAIPGRTLFLVHTAMFNAWAAYDDFALSTQNGGLLRQPRQKRTKINKEIAVSYAAYSTLVRLFTAAPQLATFSALMVTLGLDPSYINKNTENSAGIGNYVANELMNARQNDGSNQLGNQPGFFWNGTNLVHVPPQSAYGDYTGYIPVNPPTLFSNDGTYVVNNPNKWQPVIPDGTTTPQVFATPFWDLVTPFALTSANQFPLKGPHLYPSKAYKKEAKQILKITAHLTSEQKAIAEFWSAGAPTVSTFGLWNQAAQFVSIRDSHDLDEDIKLFFILNNYSLDSQIAGYYNKVHFNSERPITAIRFLYNGKHVRSWGGPFKGTERIKGQNYKSYISPVPATGEFPGTFQGSYAAGAAYILTRFTGTSRYGNSTVLALGSSFIEIGETPDAPVLLKWNTFDVAVKQASLAALYGGYQFKSSIIQGARLCKKVAKLDYEKSLSYINGTSH